MPHNLLRLAWAAPVDVEELGAALESYTKAVPAIQALRLCNRFGKGSKAFVTKLPNELVDDIADMIMVQERIKADVCWTKESTCWKSECDPHDHLTAREQQLLYLKMQGEDYKGYPRLAPNHVESPSLPALDIEDLCELDIWLVECDDEDSHEEITDGTWVERHTKNTSEWMAKVGAPGGLCRGWFSHNRDDIVKYFGLEVWAAHASFSCLHNSSCSHRITQAYLTLPIPRDARTAIPWDAEDLVDDSSHVRTETSTALQVAMPKRPRKTVMAAFPRAMSLLDLEIDEPEPKAVALAATEDDFAQKQAKSVWIDKMGKEHKSEWPKLMLLVINSHDGI